MLGLEVGNNKWDYRETSGWWKSSNVYPWNYVDWLNHKNTIQKIDPPSKSCCNARQKLHTCLFVKCRSEEILKQCCLSTWLITVSYAKILAGHLLPKELLVNTQMQTKFRGLRIWFQPQSWGLKLPNLLTNLCTCHVLMALTQPWIPKTNKSIENGKKLDINIGISIKCNQP